MVKSLVTSEINCAIAASILHTDVAPRMVQQARLLIETGHYTTSALLAFEAALREMYGDEPCPIADLVGSIVRSAAALEAGEL